MLSPVSDDGYPGGDWKDQRARLPDGHAAQTRDSRHHHTHRIWGERHHTDCLVYKT